MILFSLNAIRYLFYPLHAISYSKCPIFRFFVRKYF